MKMKCKSYVNFLFPTLFKHKKHKHTAKYRHADFIVPGFVVLSLLILVSLTACGSSDNSNDQLNNDDKLIFQEVYPENQGSFEDLPFTLDKWLWHQDIPQGAVLQEGIHYKLDSKMIPAGLSFEIKVTGKRTANFSFLGNAINHHVNDSVHGISFSFLKEAFLASSPKALIEEQLPSSINILFGIGYQLSGTIIGLTDKTELQETHQQQSLILTPGDVNFVFSKRYEEGQAFSIEVLNMTGNKACALNSPEGVFSAQNYDSLILTCSPPISPAQLTIDGIFPYRTIQYSWTDAQHATFYYLEESTDGGSTFESVTKSTLLGVQIGEYQTANSLYQSITAQYRLQSCNPQQCIPSNPVLIPQNMIVDQIDYLKASNTGGNDQFGHSLSISNDGNTMAIGAYRERSNSTGINGDQSDNTAADSGAVYVYVRTEAGWSQQAYIKASNTDTLDEFGVSVSISADGLTLAVGAHGERSNATGINGNQSNNSALYTGAVYVYSKTSFGWAQEAYIKASNAQSYDLFGSSVSLSADGNKLAVGAIYEASSATGINGNQNDNSLATSGAAYIFNRSLGNWSQEAYIKASNTASENHFGQSVSISADGNTLAVGAPLEYSDATGINGDGNQNVSGDEYSEYSGAAYIFSNGSSGWSQDAYVKASNTGENDRFGHSLSLSGDGQTLAVGAYGEDSNAIGVNGNQNNNSTSNSGAVYVLKRNNSEWSQEAYIKASNTGESDQFGYSVSLNFNGNTLAVGAKNEGSGAIGINGNQNNNAATSESGAGYIYKRNLMSWSQDAYIKSSNTEAEDGFGFAVSISADGNTLAVGANNEDSSATGVNGNQNDNDNDTSDSGAVYVY